LNAARTGLRLGLTTRADIIAEQGGDINDINNQLILEKEFADSEGLVFDGDPAKVNGSGAAQYVAPQATAQPPA
jgi:capsid protein